MSIQTISILIGLVIFLLGFTLTGLSGGRRKIALEERLPNTKDQEIDDILNDSYVSDTRYGRFHKAYVRPQLSKHPNSIQTMSRLLNVNMEKLDQKIRDAKMEKTFTVEEILSMKLIGVIGAAVFFSLGILMNFNLILVIMGLLSYMIGSMMPQRMIEKKIKSRKEEIENSLPDFLDLLKSVTESGLVIQEALNKVTARSRGALSEEFKSVMVETKSNGGQWRAAMENMAFRNDIDSLSDVVSDILISYEKGTSITGTLEKEADMMRELKSKRCLEKARGMSIKLILPMAVFSFLPLLMLLVGPMVIQMTTQMS